MLTDKSKTETLGLEIKLISAPRHTMMGISDTQMHCMTNKSDGKADQWLSQEAALRVKVIEMTFCQRCWIWHWLTVQKFNLYWALTHSVQLYTLCLTVMTVPLSHLAPVQPVKQWQRKSPFLSSQRTVPLALHGEGEHWSGISSCRKNKDTEKEVGLLL